MQPSRAPRRHRMTRSTEQSHSVRDSRIIIPPASSYCLDEMKSTRSNDVDPASTTNATRHRNSESGQERLTSSVAGNLETYIKNVVAKMAESGGKLEEGRFFQWVGENTFRGCISKPANLQLKILFEFTEEEEVRGGLCLRRDGTCKLEEIQYINPQGTLSTEKVTFTAKNVRIDANEMLECKLEGPLVQKINAEILSFQHFPGFEGQVTVDVLMANPDVVGDASVRYFHDKDEWSTARVNYQTSQDYHVTKGQYFAHDVQLSWNKNKWVCPFKLEMPSNWANYWKTRLATEGDCSFTATLSVWVTVVPDPEKAALKQMMKGQVEMRLFGSDNGQGASCRSDILCRASTVFKNMSVTAYLTGKMALKLESMSDAAIKALVIYLTSNSVKTAEDSVKIARELLWASINYQIPDLEATLEGMIRTKPGNWFKKQEMEAVKLYIFARETQGLECIRIHLLEALQPYVFSWDTDPDWTGFPPLFARRFNPVSEMEQVNEELKDFIPTMTKRPRVEQNDGEGIHDHVE